MSSPHGHFEILGQNRQKLENQQGSTQCAKKYFENTGFDLSTPRFSFIRPLKIEAGDNGFYVEVNNIKTKFRAPDVSDGQTWRIDGDAPSYGACAGGNLCDLVEWT